MNELEIQSHPYLDFSNPQHFINLVPQIIKPGILEIPHQYFEFSEVKLMARLYGNEPPADLDFELRLSFWEEYERCFEKQLEMTIANITDGICSIQWFKNHILPDKLRLMFVITQPSKTKSRMRYAHHLSMLEMLKVLKMKEQVNTKTGLIDTKLMDIKFKIFEYLDQRIHGSLIQRVEQKSLNMNVNTTMEELSKPQTPEEIDFRIEQLEKELMPQLPSPKEILSPMERTVIETGRITDPEFKRGR